MNWLRNRRERATAAISAGPLRLDPAEHRAALNGRDLDLSPLLMRLLRLLAERPQRLITRQELKQELWPNSDRIDTERRLNTAMRALRAVLRDDAASPKFIETVRSQGYRWVGPGNTDRRNDALRWRSFVGGLLALTLFGALIATAQRQKGGAGRAPLSLVRAQTAVDGWRSGPGAGQLHAAESAIATAIEAEPSSPAAHVLKAQLALEARWAWGVATAEYAEALELDPSNADARLGVAWLKVNRGDDAGALADANRLMLSSVLSGERRVELGWLLIRAGRPDLATVACPVATRSINGLSCAHTALAAVGESDKARGAALALMRAQGADAATIARLANMPAEPAYKEFLRWRARHFLPPDAFHFDRAQVLADAGFWTEALDSLARSVGAHEPLAVKIRSSPAFMGLRTNPRYQALVRRVIPSPA